jgi:hypothetical protein
MRPGSLKEHRWRLADEIARQIARSGPKTRGLIRVIPGYKSLTAIAFAAAAELGHARPSGAVCFAFNCLTLQLEIGLAISGFVFESSGANALLGSAARVVVLQS